MLCLLYLCVLASLGLYVVARPGEVIRPSLWLSCIIAVMMGGAAAFAGPGSDFGYPQAATLRFLVVIFPLAGVLWALLTPRLGGVARTVCSACTGPEVRSRSARDLHSLAGLALATISVAVVLLYLDAVPLMSTGLVTAFRDPESATIARERSLKLVSSAVVRYGYTFHVHVFAPVMIGVLVLYRSRTVFGALMRACGILALIVSVMFTGARAPAGYLLLVVGVVYLLRLGLRKGSLIVAFTGTLAICLATLMSLIREGRAGDMSFAIFSRYFSGSLMHRAFVDPFEMGVWTNLYAHDHGLMGVRNIRPLANLFGAEYFNLPNAVALAYSRNALPSSSANASFLFDFQASFGLLLGWIVALVALFLLDFALYALRGFHPSLQVPFLAAFLVAVFQLAFSAFTPCLLSHGILPIVCLGLAVSAALQWPQRPSAAPRGAFGLSTGESQMLL